ncbi:uncharacterized protein [Euwallacea fornicatus]
MDSFGSRSEPHRVSLADQLKRLENEFLFQNTFTDFRKSEIIEELKNYSQIIEGESMSLYKSTILEDLKRRIQVLMEAIRKVDTVEISTEALEELFRKRQFGDSSSPYAEHPKNYGISTAIHSFQRRLKNLNESLDNSLASSSTKEPGSKQYLEKLGVIKDFLLILREEMRCVVPMNVLEEKAVEELKRNCDDNLGEIDLNIRKLNFENYIFSARNCLSDPANINESSLTRLKGYVEKLETFDDQTHSAKRRLLDDIDDHISRLKDTLYQIAIEANLIFNNIDLMVPEEAMAYFDTASKITAVMEDIHATQYSTESDLSQSQTDALHWMRNHVINLNLWGKNVCIVHQIKEGVEYLEDLLQDLNIPFAEIFNQRLKTKISQIDPNGLPSPLKRQFHEELRRFQKADRGLPELKIEHEKRLVIYTTTLKEVEERLPLLEPKVFTFKGVKLDVDYCALKDKLADEISKLEEIEIYEGEMNDRKEALITRVEELIQVLEDRTSEFDVLSSLDKDIFNVTVLLNSVDKGCTVEVNKAKHEFYEIGDKIDNLQSTWDFKYFPDWLKSIAETHNIYEKDCPELQKTLEREKIQQKDDFNQEFKFITDEKFKN